VGNSIDGARVEKGKRGHIQHMLDDRRRQGERRVSMLPDTPCVRSSTSPNPAGCKAG
jgi:hypothetical protein